jgi:hypothetical protein
MILERFVLEIKIDPSIENGPTKDQSLYVQGRTISDTCNTASDFRIIGDQLYADDHIVTTEPGEQYSPLLGKRLKGTIDRGFSLAKDELQWHNPAFASGNALFCLSVSSGVLAVFDSFDAPTECVSVSLKPIPRKTLNHNFTAYMLTPDRIPMFPRQLRYYGLLKDSHSAWRKNDVFSPSCS